MSVPIVSNKIKETSIVVGPLNPIILLGAEGSYLPVSSYVLDGEKLLYLVDDFKGNWESGVGTYIQLLNLINRTTVISSSNSDDFVDFPVGTKIVTSVIDAKIAQQLLGLIPAPYW